MSGAKKGLDPLVECSENPESNDLNTSEDDALEVLIDETLQATTSKSSEIVTQSKGRSSDPRKKKTGSRLSLASLFSLSSQGAKDSSRERSRSGWSCDESSVVMSSLSATDLRVSASSSLTVSRRVRGSDAGSCHDDGVTEMNETLINDSDDDDLEGKKRRGKLRECPLCCLRQPLSNFPKLLGCPHRSCRLCLMQYVEMEIMENRVEVSCPECTNYLHPSDIKKLVGSRSHLIEKYEQFSIRRYLLTEADARWCPAPDCGYAVIANLCAACPQLKCGREKCGALFCYHCKGAWHANQTCDEARRTRGVTSFATSISRRITNASLDTQLKPGDIKACPRCRTYIVKMDDGSCNHMVCAMCSAEFCWLCLKEISDLHYLSPTGCTFWGKKPWTRKKKLLWQIGTLIGAPVGIALIAGLSIPGIIFGVPVFIGRKVHQRFISHSKLKRRLITAICVVGSLVVSPVLAVMAVGVGVPIMLAYVYGVVPLSLCRNGGCGLSDSSNPQDDDGIDDEEIWRDASGMERSQLLADSERQLDITSVAPTMSIQSGSISTQPVRLSVKNPKRARSPSVSSSSGRTSPDGRINYEEASTKAMAGSHCHYYYDDKSVHTMYSGHEAISYCEEVASTKALAGSVHDSKSLCESTTGRQKHDAGCDGNLHNCACMTPSTSSADNNKSQSDDVVMVLRRKFESARPRAVNIAPITQFSGDEIPPDPAPLDSVDIEAQIPCSSRSVIVQSPPQSVFHSDSREEQDPFKIRALLDNMKQMVAADVPQEKPYEPTPVRPASLQKVRRSNSGKSLVTVATHSSVPESQPLRADISTSPPKPKRGFFRNLFRSRKS